MVKSFLKKTAASPTPAPHGLPPGGRLVAIVVGIETYQDKVGGLPKVDFAHNDAKAVADLLKTLYPADRTERPRFHR